ncbi:MAG: MATE family efflux transporter [Caulobacteraceae bacterium]|nr:MATE family efflux transporter [Caulobacteraceae bacterium]
MKIAIGRSASHRAILAIALPAMLTNVATALFGLADTWVIGRLGDASAQGGVEVGAKLLMTLLVVFNFLRSGTVALTAQAAGRGEEAAQAQALARAFGVALAIGAIVLAAAPLVIPLGLSMLGASGAVAAQARRYVEIRYVGAVPWLLNCALAGWLIGRRRVRAVLAVEVGANITHIALDVGLVLGLRLGVEGVAAATLTSETVKLLALAIAASRGGSIRRLASEMRRAETWRAADLLALMRLNGALFGRTLLLMIATVLLTRAGARQGAVVLATNAILYQFFILSALLLDGFESAAQVLCGEAVGADRRLAFASVTREILALAGIAALVVTAVYALAGGRLAASFSTAPAVVASVRAHIGWAIAMPLAGFASYVFDGVFIGASWTRAMLATMAAAVAGFVALLPLTRILGDDGLWLAFTLFLLLRAAGQAALLPGLTRRSFAPVAA